MSLSKTTTDEILASIKEWDGGYKKGTWLHGALKNAISVWLKNGEGQEAFNKNKSAQSLVKAFNLQVVKNEEFQTAYKNWINNLPSSEIAKEEGPSLLLLFKPLSHKTPIWLSGIPKRLVRYMKRAKHDLSLCDIKAPLLSSKHCSGGRRKSRRKRRRTRGKLRAKFRAKSMSKSRKSRRKSKGRKRRRKNLKKRTKRRR